MNEQNDGPITSLCLGMRMLYDRSIQRGSRLKNENSDDIAMIMDQS
jgi:hypothetical protein